MKVAYLVTITSITRVIAEDTISRSELVALAEKEIVENIVSREIEDDNDSPYDPETDMLALDKNGKEICKGLEVQVPDPTLSGDLHQCEFVGTVIGIRNGNIQVEDGDQTVWEIEPERLTVFED